MLAVFMVLFHGCSPERCLPWLFQCASSRGTIAMESYRCTRGIVTGQSVALALTTQTLLLLAKTLAFNMAEHCLQVGYTYILGMNYQ